ncbi:MULTISPECIES: hypothetical protein [Psychrilyobacter]|uniref:DNA translocase FtsK 4TM region domain-containing protein n=1 Tax=Psychrilyobacter piezotolerans TaxID=2293438 RepID=A0ABX9KLE4_9FUSO|nr:MULTISPECIES: hypothetical protein [Psychrilyobacter]MCS5420581.1 hypothetical protein [Psychrilyobacter sp. S5]NDI76624.1 hypothetical protein [Psychrilyobacter piezotolerans]RDE65251.1 hypothetical protein DV867_01600 [Psychrilyobacter sp. S5]REI42869.1 hypothetical protein DYH56_01600 [Psychrilyobacter piezotolerans]
MNKKRKFFILLKIILIVFLIYIYAADGKKIYLSGAYECLEEVLGGFRSVLIPYLILSIFSAFISDLNKKTVFLMRLNFFFILLICLSNLQLLFYLDNLEKDDLEKKIFVYLYVHKNLGMLITMFLYKFYFLVPVNINIAVTGTILFFSSFILFGKIIGNMVRKILKYYLKENREKRKKIRNLIKEEKKIKKQILEKEKRERVEREKQTIIEKTREKQRKERILELKNKMEKNKKTSMGKQLKISGIEIDDEKLKEEKIKKEDAADGIEEATEGQLRFKFKTEEV